MPMLYWRALASAGVLHEAIDLHTDVRRFRSRVRKRDGFVEGDARLLVAPELHQQRTLDAVEIEVAGERLRQRLDLLERRRGTAAPCRSGHRAIERHDGRRLHALERFVEEIDLRPVRVFGFAASACSAAIAAWI